MNFTACRVVRLEMYALRPCSDLAEVGTRIADTDSRELASAKRKCSALMAKPSRYYTASDVRNRRVSWANREV